MATPHPFSTIDHVPLTILRTSAPDALTTLAEAIADIKDGDPLAPVTVIVPTNVCGVMARRGLGRAGGVAGVDMVTLNRVAELLAGPGFAAERRQPVSAPVVDLTIRRVLAEAPGMFAGVAEHPATVVALRRLHEELRLAGPDAADSLRSTGRGREAVRVSEAVGRILARAWYDEADLLTAAADLLDGGVPAPLRRLVAHLPAADDTASRRLLARLADDAELTAIVQITGDAEADALVEELLTSLDASASGIDTIDAPAGHPAPCRPEAIISTTDADDEVRHAVRAIVDAARGAITSQPVPFERIGVLWSSHRPYARLVEHHLELDDIPWNGRGGTELGERITSRLLLDLLDVDRHGLRRSDVFDLLADIPARDDDGRPLPTAEWERASRTAGVSRGDDWEPRLAALARHDRWRVPATSLSRFIDELRTSIGHPRRTRSWNSWIDWCDQQIETWLGRRGINALTDDEYRAWEQLSLILERLRSLDSISDEVPRAVFRSVLESEIDDAAPRHGRIGHGVTVGSLAGASGLDVDVAIVLGGAEGLLPPVPASDPLLSERERQAAGLTTAATQASRLHHNLLGLFASAHVIVTVPRGDLRVTTANQTSRWVAEAAEDPDRVHTVASALSGLVAQAFAPCERERRLRARVLMGSPAEETDLVLTRAIALRRARSSPDLTEFDGNLSSIGAPRLGDDPVSPTRLETWIACPHAYFMRYLLGVHAIDEPDRAVTVAATDRGLVQHATLDRFHRDVCSGRLPQPVDGWGPTHLTALLTHFDDVCLDLEHSGRAGRPATWAVEKRLMRADLVGWFTHDADRCRERGSTVLESELAFGLDQGVELHLPDDRRLAVMGTIDRIDRTRDGGLIVTDHKTGKADQYKKLSVIDPTLGGSRLQLPAYAAAALARHPDSSGVRAEYSMFGRGKYGRHGYEFTDEVWGDVEDQLAEVVDGIESGYYPQLPERPGFRLYVTCAYCEPDALGTADAWARWVRKRSDERISRWFGGTSDDSAEGET